MPTGNNESEAKLLAELESYDEVEYTMGLSNIEAMNGYMLIDKLTPRDFSELTDIDYEVAKLLYAAYALKDKNYNEVVTGLDVYGVPLIDMFMFLYEQVQEGYVKLDEDLQETLDDAYVQLNSAKQQLQGENYSRILVNLNLPTEGDKTFGFWILFTKLQGKL